jgi:hypothetical protein
MTLARRIQPILRATLSLSLASAGVASCDGSDTDSTAVTDSTEVASQVACDADPCQCYLEGVTPAAPADYIELRALPYKEGEPLDIIDSTGTKCGTASDKAACKAAIAAATSTDVLVGKSNPFETGGFGPAILIVNRGDNVEVIDTAEGVTSLLAPIDTPREAVLIASLARYLVSCDDVEGGGVHAVGSGFELPGTKFTQDCFPVERKRYVLGVSAAGEVTEIESEVIEYEPGWCI